VSVEAITWALNLAPVPLDPGTGKRKDPKPNSACAFVLVALANHADPDGSNAFPGVDTICRYTRLSERTVRTALDRLEDIGVIRPCDPDVVAAKIKRADRRPNGYDLDYALIRDDLSAAELAKIGRDNPWLRHWIEATQRGATVAGRASERGATDDTDGVQPLPSRGAVVAPEPSFEPPKEPSVARKRGTRIPEAFEVDPAMRSWAASQNLAHLDLDGITESFVDYWRSQPGQRGVKLDWFATWRNWVRKELSFRPAAGATPRRSQWDRAVEVGSPQWQQQRGAL